MNFLAGDRPDYLQEKYGLSIDGIYSKITNELREIGL